VALFIRHDVDFLLRAQRAIPVSLRKSVFTLVVSIAFYAAVLVLFSSPARGQQSGQKSATSKPETTDPGVRQDPRDRISPMAPDWARAMRESGGSLLRASGGASAEEAGPMPRSEYERVSLFAVPPPPPRVIRPHDLVTIIVREQSEYSSTGSIDLTKEASLNAIVNEFVRLSSGLELVSSIGAIKPEIDLSGNREFKGEGSTDRSDSISARVTAQVIDVRPNGTLVLAARKRIITDEEEQIFLMSGIARATDISLDNTILSTQLGDFDLQKKTKGPVRNATKRGWLPRFLDALNPF